MYNVYCNALRYQRIVKKIQNNEFIIISNVEIKSKQNKKLKVNKQ